ncbi:MAG: hypothetical protein MJY65_06625 [Bacteroidaceae bacterium]|nr:hypothetical protein [Bacteroidaceae bacterium]
MKKRLFILAAALMTVVCLASCNKGGDSGSSEAGEKQKIQSALHEAMMLMTGETGEPVTSAILSKMKAERESKGLLDFSILRKYKICIAHDDCFNAGDIVQIKVPEAQLATYGLDAMSVIKFQIVAALSYHNAIVYIIKSDEMKSSVQEDELLTADAIPISLVKLLAADIKDLFFTKELSNLLAGNTSLIKGVDNIEEGGYVECQHLCLTVEDGTPKLAGILNQCGSVEGISPEEDEIVFSTKSGIKMNFKSLFAIINSIFSN